MRKTLLFSLVVMFASLAVAQQWQVVSSVSVFNQNRGIASTTLLTPSDPGSYRVTFYLSSSGISNSPGYYEAVVAMQDISGQSGTIDIPTACNGVSRFLPTIEPISLKPGVPVTYAVNASGSPGACVYNLSIAIEKLQ